MAWDLARVVMDKARTNFFIYFAFDKNQMNKTLCRKAKVLIFVFDN